MENGGVLTLEFRKIILWYSNINHNKMKAYNKISATIVT